MVNAPKPLSLDSRRPVEILGTELGPADFLMIAQEKKHHIYIYYIYCNFCIYIYVLYNV